MTAGTTGGTTGQTTGQTTGETTGETSGGTPGDGTGAGEERDLVGVGIGPFNLSLAALADGVRGLSALFLAPRVDRHERERRLLAGNGDIQRGHSKRVQRVKRRFP